MTRAYFRHAGLCSAGAAFLIAAGAMSTPVEASQFLTLYAFKGGGDGENPNFIPPVIMSRGVLYGVTTDGGRMNSGCSSCGTVYAIEQTSPGEWSKTSIFKFSGANGAGPNGQLAADDQGNLYGVTGAGGGLAACEEFHGCGVVYKLTRPATDGGKWQQSILYRFKNENDGWGAIGGLTLEKGVLYGSTSSGGPNGNGTLFKLEPPSSSGDEWKKTYLANLPKKLVGPAGTLIAGKSGKIYGTTSSGSGDIAGSVFVVLPPTGSATKGTLKILHTFHSDTPRYPQYARLAIGSDGKIYGTTWQGGPGGCGSGCGSVFRLTETASGGSDFKLIRTFKCDTDGAQPAGGVTFGPGGFLYGTTTLCGDNSYGTLFRLTPPASGDRWDIETLHEFDSASQGWPYSQLLVHNSVVFGVTGGGVQHGSVYRVRP